MNTNNDQTLYHRLDRLSVTFQPYWGTLQIGRQALTWGNGFLFNPMDLFNPFSPTQIDREYKPGDDMVSILFNKLAAITPFSVTIKALPGKNFLTIPPSSWTIKCMP